MQNKCDSAEKDNDDEIKLNQNKVVNVFKSIDSIKSSKMRNNDEILLIQNKDINVLKSIDSIKSSKMTSNLDQNVLDII